MEKQDIFQSFHDRLESFFYKWIKQSINSDELWDLYEEFREVRFELLNQNKKALSDTLKDDFEKIENFFSETLHNSPPKSLLSKLMSFPREFGDILFIIERIAKVTSGKAGDRTKKHNIRGRQKKYSDDVIKRAIELHDDEYAKSKDDKAAWNETAKRYGFPSGEAARRTVTRRMKKLR